MRAGAITEVFGHKARVAAVVSAAPGDDGPIRLWWPHFRLPMMCAVTHQKNTVRARLSLLPRLHLPQYKSVYKYTVVWICVRFLPYCQYLP